MKIYSTSFLILLLIISGLIVVFLLFPQYQNYKILNKELSLKREELSSKNEYFNSIHATKQILDGKKDDLSKIDNALPLDPDPVIVLLSIQKKASDNGVVITKVNSLSVEDGNKRGVKGSFSGEKNSFRKIKISLSLAGSYESIVNFISSLEKDPRIINIEEMSILSNKKNKNSMDLEIKVESYFRKYNL